MGIAVIILNYNDSNNTYEITNKLSKYDIVDKIIVVDNISTDNSFLFLKKLESDKVKIIQSEKNGGYAYGNNFGARYLIENYNIEYVMICNPDIEIEEAVIKEMLDFSRSHDSACVSPLSIKPDGKVSQQIAWNFRGFFIEAITTLKVFAKIFSSRISLKEIEGHISFKVDILPGSLLFIDMKKYIDIDLMDEKTFLYCEERILGKRLEKMNYSSYLLTNQTYVHRHSESINRSIKSGIKKSNIYLDSRMIYLKNYYKMNVFRLLLIKIIYFIAKIETIFIQIIKKN